MWWAAPWVWFAGALVLAILEVVLPGFVLLGFAIGAALVGAILWLGVSLSGPMLALVFAVVSLIAWLALRRVLGVQKGQVKTFDHDIND